MVRLVLLGPPGAGKGTQAQRLSEALGVPHISTGVILREAVAEGSELGMKAKEVMDAGHLVSDEIMLGIIQERLAQKDCERGFILDGFPRTIPQAKALDELLEARPDRPPVVVANLELDEEELRRRIAGRRNEAGRSDDAEETVLSRFQVYQEKTRPLLDYYGERVAPIDGKGSVDEVFQRLEALVREAARRDAGRPA